ncbi:MAG: spore coat protein CotH, partial [Croceitalea sp.]|nr:spore coat protein CotH [Croceitalea sp.]
MVKFTVYMFMCFFVAQVHSQAQSIKAKKGSFAIDKSKNIIVWHQSNIDTVVLVKNIKGFRFRNKYRFNKPITSLSHNKKYQLSRKGKTFDLYISKLPLVQIEVDTPLNKDTKVLGSYKYYNKKNFIESSLGIEFRGNLSLTYPKKTFDIEFWRDSIWNKSRDITFENLRNDDDWILDGMYNEPLRIRSYVANKLWTAIRKPYGQDEVPFEKSGIDLIYVEVFKNQKYQGVYTLTESVDRKLLGLQK